MGLLLIFGVLNLIDAQDRVEIGFLNCDGISANLVTQNPICSNCYSSPDHYINIRLFPFSNENLLGFASYPNTVPKEKDGIVINTRNIGFTGSAFNSRPYHLGRTLTHEMGHYFNLLHPWGIYRGDCDEMDFVDDTPAQSDSEYGCEASFSCGGDDNFHNFMGFQDDECMWFFTEGQCDRMRQSIMAFRSELINNQNVCGNSSVVLEDDLISIFPNPTTDRVIIVRDFSLSGKEMNRP